jgi:hypothetical protein
LRFFLIPKGKQLDRVNGAGVEEGEGLGGERGGDRPRIEEENHQFKYSIGGSFMSRVNESGEGDRNSS